MSTGKDQYRNNYEIYTMCACGLIVGFIFLL